MNLNIMIWSKYHFYQLIYDMDFGSTKHTHKYFGCSGKHCKILFKKMQYFAQNHNFEKEEVPHTTSETINNSNTLPNLLPIFYKSTKS